MIEKECWNLDKTFADFILPRLLYFRNWMSRMGTPWDFIDDEEGWEETLDEIIWAFTYISKEYPSVAELYIDGAIFKDNTFELVLSSEEDYIKGQRQDRVNQARCQHGLNLFAKYYRDLWD